MAKGDLHKKLLAIAGELGAIAKDSRNKQQNYDYVSAEAFIEAVRVPMLKHGVLIMPRITATWEQQNTKNSVGTAAHTNAVYVVTDGIEEFEVSVPGQGWDSLDKAVYKALTGGFKYLLRMLFMLPMEDDPEQDRSSGGGQRGQPQQQSAPRPQGDGSVEPKNRAGGDSPGFEMSDQPMTKQKLHIFAKAAEFEKPEGRFNGWTWEQMAKGHGSAMRAGQPADSPLVAIIHGQYFGGWVKEHAAYLAQQIDAKVAPPAVDPDRKCTECGNAGPWGETGECLSCIPF